MNDHDARDGQPSRGGTTAATCLLWALAVLMVGVLGFVIWIGRAYDEAAKPAPNADPALGPPAFHPGDPGVIDLRGRKAHEDFDEAVDRPSGKQQEAR